MKFRDNRKLCWCIAVLAGACGTTAEATVYDPLANGSFEQGLSGWDLSATGIQVFTWGGVASVDPLALPSIQNQLITQALTPPPSLISPVDGSQALSLFNRQSSTPRDITLPNGEAGFWMSSGYTISLSQTVVLPTDATLSGWARFWTWDFNPYQDRATVTVNGHEVWQKSVADVYDPVTGFGLGLWEPWTTTVPAGTYTIALNVSGDSQLDSAGFFDGMRIQIATIPEIASTAALLGLSIFGMAGFATVRGVSLFRRRVSARPSSSGSFKGPASVE